MQRIREGDIYYPDNRKGMERFADKDAYNLGNPLRENKDTAIIFTALCARAAMDGGLSPRIAKQLEVQYMQTMMQSPMLTSANTSRANYVWLPITFEEGKPKIHWRDSWKLSDFE